MSTRQPGVGEAPGLVSVIWRRRWVLLACLILGGLLGYGLSSLQPSRYSAESRVILSADQEFNPLPDNQQGDPVRFLNNQAANMTLNAVLQQVITSARLDTNTFELRRKVTVSPAADSDVITVEAVADTPAAAKAIADGIPAAYRAFVSDRKQATLERALAATPGVAAKAAITAQGAAYGDGVGTVEAADLPRSPSSPQPLRDGLLLALLALLVGAAGAVLRQQRLSGWATPIQSATVLDAPLLSVVPRQSALTSTGLAPLDSPARHSYRMAAITLDYIRGPAPWSAFVTAARHGAGASTTAVNVASAVADQGLRVILIDIEEGSRPASGPDAYRYRVSLDHLAEGHVNMATAIQRHPGTSAEFGIIHSRIAPFADGQQAIDMRAILERLPDGTDMVIIDGPPVLTNADAFALAGQVDAVVVVVDTQTPIEVLDELQSRCDLTGVRIGGVIANELPRRGLGRGNRRSTPAMGHDGDALGSAIPADPLVGSPDRSNGRVGVPDDSYRP